MPKYRVDISKSAENNLYDIVRYISAQLHTPITVLKTMDAIEEPFSGLMDMLQKYPTVIDERLAASGYRKLLVKNYVVFLSIDKKSTVIAVERILYTRRGWLRIL